MKKNTELILNQHYFSNCASCQRGGGECQREVQLLRMKEDFDVTIWVGIYYDVIC